MKTSILGFIAISLLISCKDNSTIAQKEIKPSPQQYTINQFMDSESIWGRSFSAENSSVLVTSNRSGIYNAYTIPVRGGDMTPVTQSDSTSMFALSFFPEDNRILLSADNNGNEINHIYVKEPNGVIKDITPFEGAKSSFYGWAKDKKHLYYGSNKRDPKFFDVYKLAIEDYTSTMIYQNNDGLDLSEISDDENFIALSKPLNTNDTDLFLYNVETKEMTKINDNNSANAAQGFSKDNSTLYYTTDDGSEHAYLASYNLNSKEKKPLIEKSWDIMGSVLTTEGTYMVVYTNEDGKNTIDVFETETMTPITLPDFGNNSITNVGFSRDETWMGMYVGGSNTPSNLYTYNLEATELNKLTNVLNDDINVEDMVTAKVIRYKSFDGTVIPAIYYLPHNASKEHKVPALVWVHGGPGGQSRQNFNPLIQYLVNHGYAILAVNNRGSSGYGKTFYKMDDKNHGEKDLQDCVEGRNWLAGLPEIDPDKIGIIGGSYGGYMTMAALTYTPEEFEVGVNIFGVTNWLRTLKSIPPYWESFREALYLELGDPFSADSVRLKRISPLFHTENVTKPLMVLQGAKDPRVLQMESDEIVAGVRKNNVPVEYVLFEDEGHGFMKKENEIEAYGGILKFLDQYLKNGKPPITKETPETEIKG
ncbi:alpha/beta fold hydrolase [Mangrovimonas sp. TPBH4]|uniref:S9 family peptidase n=1 Tax=Mangrovimonas sp. TPBH4 TaxID=1645914 RepID=UPI0006B4990D|nr:alpha/beta fold hydrolase [Mangrovimonas sp. TPBH4]